MIENNWRREIFKRIKSPWDVIVIGGGISGTGIFLEAARLGLKTLLVEKRDFAWGTSSRSSKLIHGGLRYLKEGNLMLTRASVKERERLLQEAIGLVEPLGFLLMIYDGDFPGRWTYGAGLSIYDLLALHWDHRYIDPVEINLLAPHVSKKNLRGGYQFYDAQTDDARLVFRLIQEGISEGGTAVNYVEVKDFLYEEDRVKGIKLLDLEEEEEYLIDAKVVINATGVWVDELRSRVEISKVIRPLRGSHLVFHSWRLPVAQAVSFLHPSDHRPVFIFPWEGVTIVGTTDVDHEQSLDIEPSINPGEVSYLMAAVENQFPSLNIDLKDIISTFAGIRPIIGTGKSDPSHESRGHYIWDDNGLITVTGGKLTTFRLLTLDVLEIIRNLFPGMDKDNRDAPVFHENIVDSGRLKKLNIKQQRRLLGRYGNLVSNVIDIARDGELSSIPGTPYLWAEIRWAVRAEYICHLEDILLRRLRIGLILKDGGKWILPQVKAICRQELSWSDHNWEEEKDIYLHTWKSKYYLPDFDTIPDWKTGLLNKKRYVPIRGLGENRRTIPKNRISGILLLISGISIYLLWKNWRTKRFSQ